MVRAIVGLARGLGKVVVAEGVETEAQARLLRQLGCQLGQGFLYGRPAPELAAPVPNGMIEPKQFERPTSKPTMRLVSAVR
jgi:EAL domain-containing protein (putative c-di-GMP-specific phosphodiesterase class I)